MENTREREREMQKSRCIYCIELAQKDHFQSLDAKDRSGLLVATKPPIWMLEALKEVPQKWKKMEVRPTFVAVPLPYPLDKSMGPHTLDHFCLTFAAYYG